MCNPGLDPELGKHCYKEYFWEQLVKSEYRLQIKYCINAKFPDFNNYTVVV